MDEGTFNSDSILESVKKLLGINPNDKNFDVDLIIHINSVLPILTQLGVGSDQGFSISGSDELWSDYIPQNKGAEFIKTYVAQKVRLIFDPPQSSAAIEAIKDIIKELEWRINVAVDTEGGDS